ncbi:MAG: hypothetical protein ABR875_02700 [Minisyncoccia bacterium]
MTEGEKKYLLARLDDLSGSLEKNIGGADLKNILESEKMVLKMKLDILSLPVSENVNMDLLKKPRTSSIGFIHRLGNKKNREEIEKKILDLIGDRLEVDSQEIYAFLPEINKRNVRRVLSQLVASGRIRRAVKGNLAFISRIE